MSGFKSGRYSFYPAAVSEASMNCLLMFLAGLIAAPALAHDSADHRRTPVVEAVEKAAPSVVAIDCKRTVQSPFAMLGSYDASSQGSGVIIHESGLVLTNAHVVDGASGVTAHTLSGESYTAMVVAVEPDLDLAVLKLQDAEGLRAIELATEQPLILGEPTIAIGNPYGLGLTVSTGVISSPLREIETRDGVSQSFVQTDAAINPGNSGGALVDINGALIGINTAIYPAGEGIGFAIPVDRAWKVAGDLLTYGSLRAPWLAVDLDDIDPHLLRGTSLEGEAGAVVVTRVHDSAVGLKTGDVLFKVEGRPVRSRADLNTYLGGRSPGDSLSVSLYREKSLLDASVRTTEIPEDIGATTLKSVVGMDVAIGRKGLTISKLSSRGSASEEGLQVGDVLLSVDGVTVRDSEGLAEVLARAKANHRATVYVLVRRGPIRGGVILPI